MGPDEHCDGRRDHARWRSALWVQASCRHIALKGSASNVLELFLYAQETSQSHPQHTHTTPWLPYTRPCPSPTATRRSLVRRGTSSACSSWYVCRKRSHTPVLRKVEFERCHIPPSPSPAGSVLVDVSTTVTVSKSHADSFPGPTAEKRQSSTPRPSSTS
jgi:hypothetical protein